MNYKQFNIIKPKSRQKTVMIFILTWKAKTHDWSFHCVGRTIKFQMCVNIKLKEGRKLTFMKKEHWTVYPIQKFWLNILLLIIGLRFKCKTKLHKESIPVNINRIYCMRIQHALIGLLSKWFIKNWEINV